MAGDEKKPKSNWNWPQIIVTIVVTIILGAGGMFNFADIKKDAAEREIRLSQQQAASEKRLSERLDEIEIRTEQLLTLSTTDRTDINWIKEEVKRLRDGR
jgi:cytoskeletal protein RodZ